SSLLHCDYRGCWESFSVFFRHSGVTTCPVRIRVRKVPKTGCEGTYSRALGNAPGSNTHCPLNNTTRRRSPLTPPPHHTLSHLDLSPRSSPNPLLFPSTHHPPFLPPPPNKSPAGRV
ncbi:hypothetical protein KUCAC02_027230, partial [Chaenocephalus aceratus]